MATAALTAGCSSSGDAAVAEATNSSAVTTATEPATVAAPSTAAETVDAEAVLAELTAAGLPLTDSAAVTETNDANNDSDAQARSDYIQQTLKSLGPLVGTEYHYLSGPILVRVNGELVP